eukprot:CAMPEP_0206478618 /NCGR_PEP_ID=MMETSP0324_2-20121206/36157_1 /ASSEMBLY_ACC=CAM_ASM_000836 /TAXON_ID=2866 /ORGANISM="Crypthecodinium cohnii, Strain Seligo" /LENGTH=91 /DNA_ID=CAMNT_0053954951 /DNA_START=294 /DNA_END=570 /DNA_ORIENTATION=-
MRGGRLVAVGGLMPSSPARKCLRQRNSYPRMKWQDDHQQAGVHIESLRWVREEAHCHHKIQTNEGRAMSMNDAGRKACQHQMWAARPASWE